DAVRHQFDDGSPIAYHEALEAPFLAKNLFQSKWIGGRRNPVQGIKRTHECCNAGLLCGVKRRQIELPERVFGDFSAVVLSPCFRGSISHVMFYASHNAVRGVE